MKAWIAVNVYEPKDAATFNSWLDGQYKQMRDKSLAPNTYGARRDVAPQDVSFVTDEMKDGLKPSEMAGIMDDSSKKYIFYSGFITYRDGYNNFYSTEFCYMFFGKTKRLGTSAERTTSLNSPVTAIRISPKYPSPICLAGPAAPWPFRITPLGCIPSSLPRFFGVFSCREIETHRAQWRKA